MPSADSVLGSSKQPRLAVELLDDVDRVLILQAVVAGIEVAAPFLVRQAEALVVPQLRQPLADPLAAAAPASSQSKVTLFCASTQALVSALSGSSSQRYGSATFVPW